MYTVKTPPSTKNRAPKMLTRESVFVLGWKICVIDRPCLS